MKIVAKTVANAYAAKREWDVAVKERKDLSPYNLAPEEARKAEPSQESACVSRIEECSAARDRLFATNKQFE
jgi:hypothetical protein